MKTKISVEVSAKAAEVFQSSTPQERRDLAQIIEHHLVQRPQSLAEFSRVAERIGNYAKGEGLTRHKLHDLLADES